MDIPPVVYSLVDGHLGCFRFLATLNNDTMDIWVQIFVWTKVFNSLIPRSIYLGVEFLGPITLCLTC